MARNVGCGNKTRRQNSFYNSNRIDGFYFNMVFIYRKNISDIDKVNYIHDIIYPETYVIFYSRLLLFQFEHYHSIISVRFIKKLTLQRTAKYSYSYTRSSVICLLSGYRQERLLLYLFTISYTVIWKSFYNTE